MAWDHFRSRAVLHIFASWREPVSGLFSGRIRRSRYLFSPVV